jgi:hypothetical protein
MAMLLGRSSPVPNACGVRFRAPAMSFYGDKRPKLRRSRIPSYLVLSSERYKVAREIFSVLQISSIVLFLSSYSAIAICARGKRFWPAAFPSTGPGGVESCLGALPDDIPLKFCQRSEDVKDQFSA